MLFSLRLIEYRYMDIAETIARLDSLDRELEVFRNNIRLFRHDLFEIHSAADRKENA